MWRGGWGIVSMRRSKLFLLKAEYALMLIVCQTQIVRNRRPFPRLGLVGTKSVLTGHD